MARATVSKTKLIERIEAVRNAEVTAYAEKLKEHTACLSNVRDALLEALDTVEYEIENYEFCAVSTGYRGEIYITLPLKSTELLGTVNPPLPPDSTRHDRAISLLELVAKDEISVNLQDYSRYL